MLSQNEELQKIYNALDTMIKKESHYFPKSSNSMTSFFYSYEKHSPNGKYDDKVFDYIEPYMHDTLHNLKYISCVIIGEIGLASKKEKIRQRALNDLLTMAVIISDTWWYIPQFDQKDFDRNAKKRLKQLLIEPKTDYEVQVWAEYEKRRHLHNKGFKVWIEERVKKDSLSRDFVIDSLLRISIDTAAYRQPPNISNRKAYLLPGWLYMYDFIPELEAMVQNPHQGLQLYIKLSLARLGVKKYEEQILKSDANWEWVSFINTQTAYSWFVDYMNRTTDFTYCDLDDYSLKAPLSQAFYLIITRNILYFPEKYRVACKMDWKQCEFNKEELIKFEQGKNWLEENKGKYKLDKTSW